MSRSPKNTAHNGSEGNHSAWRHLPNGLSLLRLALIPVIFWLTLNHEHLWALIVFCIAALSDILDGWLANKYSWQTRFGSLLDPVADRVFILCLIPLLWHLGAINGAYTGLVVTRFAIQLSAFPVLLWWLKKEASVKPDWLSRGAMTLAYLVLGMGFADQVAIEQLDETSGAEVMLDHTIDALTVIGGILEVWVLLKFVPRYWNVIRGRADTFE